MLPDYYNCKTFKRASLETPPPLIGGKPDPRTPRGNGENFRVISASYPHVVFETNLAPLLKKVVAGGGGVTTLLEMAVNEPELVAISFNPQHFVEAVVVWKKHAYRSK
jgi:hypothetical protein